MGTNHLIKLGIHASSAANPLEGDNLYFSSCPYLGAYLDVGRGLS